MSMRKLYDSDPDWVWAVKLQKSQTSKALKGYIQECNYLADLYNLRVGDNPTQPFGRFVDKGWIKIGVWAFDAYDHIMHDLLEVFLNAKSHDDGWASKESMAEAKELCRQADNKLLALQKQYDEKERMGHTYHGQAFLIMYNVSKVVIEADRYYVTPLASHTFNKRYATGPDAKFPEQFLKPWERSRADESQWNTRLRVTYRGKKEMPKWIQNKLSVLQVIDSEQEVIDDVGCKINDEVYFVFDA